MSFIHLYLLGGLLLVGVPVLLHLIMQQKPKRLVFPAFRFLKQRQRTNQRKLRLHQLLLLALRVLALALLCIGLARPRLFADRFVLLHADRPVVAALVFDTSASMEYVSGGRSRLDDARQRARELLDEMDPGSRVAVIESGEEGNESLMPVADARARIEALRVRADGAALNRAVDRAVAVLRGEPDAADSPPRVLYVFSDRTRGCWDAAGVKPALPDGVAAAFVDVGVEKPRDLAIESVEVVPAAVPPGGRIEVRVRVRGTPGGHENELACQIDNDPEKDRAADRAAVRLGKEQTSDVIVLERPAPTPPPGSPDDAPFQLTVRLGTRDALSFNNVRHATFVVRGGRRLLTLVETDKKAARVWQAIHESTRGFKPELRTLDEAGKLTPRELAGYAAVALFQVKDVPADWAAKLDAYVRGGGGLVIVPPGDEAGIAAFNERLGALLPAPLAGIADAPGGKLAWAHFGGAHALMAPFVKWGRSVDPDFERNDLRPFARRYWKLKPLAKDALSVAAYVDRSPALAERAVGSGKVVLFTAPLDVREVAPGVRWDNYLESSFLLVLVDQVCRYLGGESAAPELNFRTGDVPHVALPGRAGQTLSVTGPGLAGAEQNVAVPRDGPVLLKQAVLPGNYQLSEARPRRLLAGFSLDVPAAESDLQRVPAEELEAVFGAGSVVEVGRTVSLREAMTSGRLPPLELLPLLLVLLLVVMTGESLLSQRFSRRTLKTEGP